MNEVWLANLGLSSQVPIGLENLEIVDKQANDEAFIFRNIDDMLFVGHLSCLVGGFLVRGTQDNMNQRDVSYDLRSAKMLLDKVAFSWLE
jgi:hypothetical protein